MNGKVCTKCHTLKTYDEFPKYTRYYDGYRPDCKTCCNARNKLNYYKDLTKSRLRSRVDRKNHPQTYRTWLAKNKKQKNAYKSQRRKLIIQATPKWADIQAIISFYKNCPEGYQVDHIVPIKGKHICGLHVLENLQYLPKFDNLSKGNKINLDTLTEFAVCTV
jgi:hypothetical protein